MYALTNCRIITGFEMLEDHALVIDKNKIVALCKNAALAKEIKTLSLDGAYLCAGFIDLQLNGCGGVNLNTEISAKTIRTMQLSNQKFGCTSFLPTLITSSNGDIKAAVSAMLDYKTQYSHQALGLHLEGPFINTEKKGTHDPNYIRRSDDEMIDFMVQHAKLITKVTLAPELTAKAHIQKLVNAGIVVSMGHTNASFTQAIEGINQGISFATHLFNAMTSLSAREPGVLGAIFDSPEVYAGIIADGFHVDFANIRTAKKIKGDKLVLVTDAVAPAGTKMQSFQFAGKTILHKDGRCLDENGIISGSAITMIDSVKNTVEKVGLALDEAVRMATWYPAKAIGVQNELGCIKAGYIANLAAFDRNFTMKAVVVNGDYQAL